MGKRTYLSDITAMALLYREKYAKSEMISYDKILEFDKIINETLEEMNSDIGTRIPSCDDKSDLFVIMKDENGILYAVINPNANLKDAWHNHIGCLPLDVIIASQNPNALSVINLELIGSKMKNKESDKEKIKIKQL